MKTIVVLEDTHAKIKEWSRLHKQPMWVIVDRLVNMARETVMEEATDDTAT